MKIEVTQQDIEEGKTVSDRCCPIALALVRTTAGKSWLVLNLTATCETDNYRFPLPEIASAFIEKFDRGNPVSPFTFELTDL